MELLRFYAEVYVRTGKQLRDLEMRRYRDTDGGKKETALTLEDSIEADRVLENAKKVCETIGLQVSARHASELLESGKQGHLSATDVEALGGFAPDGAEDIVAATRSFVRRLTQGLPEKEER